MHISTTDGTSSSYRGEKVICTKLLKGDMPWLPIANIHQEMVLLKPHIWCSDEYVSAVTALTQQLFVDLSDYSRSHIRALLPAGAPADLA